MSDTSSITQLVVIGASAGGIEALSKLVATLPADFPAPVVIAQHVDPRRLSHLPEILGVRTSLPVRLVENHEQLEGGVIYVVPANRHVEITDHALSVSKGDHGRSKPSVDLLFSSAAEVFGEGLIAVILTGTGSDGAAGARVVKNAGGTVVIENPETAAFPGMPLSLAPTMVDIVANLEAIGPLLHDLLTKASTSVRGDVDRQLRGLLEQLRETSGIDFASYKTPTIMRRLQRRIAATGAEDLGAYIRFIQRNPDEYQRLVNSFLIKVTEFFRDPDLFTYLREQILPDLLAKAQQTGELRIWSAGCATGEEAYSIAILVSELLDAATNINVRIFATDVDGEAVAFARRGVYPASAVAEVPPPLVERYFNQLDGAYEIKKAVRSLVIFGQHDLGQRAPFPRVDLTLCRNVLIYFTTELQRRALQLFAFSLRDGGYLVLGKAETVTPLAEFFALEQARLKIYRRIGDRVLIPPSRIRDAAPITPHRPGPAPRWTAGPELPTTRTLREMQRARGVGDRAENLLRRLPIGVVVVDRRFDIISINNVARRLLGIHSTAIGEDFIHLVRNVPLMPLRNAIEAAFRRDSHSGAFQLDTTEPATGEELCLEITCHPERFDHDGSSIEAVTILVRDISETVRERRELEQNLAQQRTEATNLGGQLRRLTEANRQLLEANQELTAANAELRSANEELLVSSEEAQAATEEIETLNEELQATNEELETLNEELQATVEELNTTNDDLEARSIELQDLAVTLEHQARRSEAERARLAALLSGIGDAVLVVDRQGQTVLTNHAYQTMFGTEELAVLDEQRRPLASENTPQQRAARGESFNMEFALVGPDSALRYFEASGQGVQNPEGELQWGVLVIRDITDRSLRRLQDQFLALASHELRTPLTTLQGYLELINKAVDGEGQASRLNRYMPAARRAARDLGALINDLMDVTRLQTGKLTLNQQPLDLREVVTQAVAMAEMVLGGPRMRVEPSPTPLPIQGDELRLRQVLLNLLTNAAVYAPQSERIDIRLGRVDQTAEIQIQDYGPGIPANALPHLFSRYYQISQPNRSEGLGLGLYIVNQLVIAHGGTITAQSVEGQGTTFTICLPLRADEL